MSVFNLVFTFSADDPDPNVTPPQVARIWSATAHAVAPDDSTSIVINQKAGTSAVLQFWVAVDDALAQPTQWSKVGATVATTPNVLSTPVGVLGKAKVFAQVVSHIGSITEFEAAFTKPVPGGAAATVTGTITANQGTMTPVVSASGDGELNSVTLGRVGSWLFGFNGTTWDRVRTAIVAKVSTFVGILNTIVMGRYNASPPALTDGDVQLLQLDVSGYLRAAEQYVTGWSYSNLGVTAGTTVKSGAGVLHLIAINRPIASGTITIYDNTAASGTKIGTITLPGSIVSDCDEMFYDAAFSTGLTIVTTGTNIDVTVIYA